MAIDTRKGSVLVILTGIIVALLGVAVGGLGAWLYELGGSPYYLVTGILMLLSGLLVVRGYRAGAWLYGLILLGTLIWAVREVGLDGWALIPRLVAPAVLGLLVFAPFVSGRLGRGGRGLAYGGMAFCLACLIFVFASGYATTAARFIHPNEPTRWDAATTEPADQPADDGDWRFYGHTPSGDRFSSLGQITPANVGQLQEAWSFSTGDLPRPGENSDGREFSFEATPIKVGDSLYFCTPHRDVVALDATTGQQRWRFSPGGDMSQNVYQACRGVAYAEAPAGAPCPHRIISTASDLPRLFALDADTGKLCPSFGDNGMVDLRQDMGIVPPGFHFISSPPLVLDNKIMLSGWVYDNQTEGEPSGVIRAFDATTGTLAWSWDIGRANPNSKPAAGETFTRGTPNGWGVYTADPELGLVYVPLGNPTPDYFGGERRPFDETYSSALVALDIATGKERWHFQAVHHDLWDFDLPIGPSLVDLPGPDGKSIPGLVQTNKQGELFVLDRRDGHPLADVEERPVPAGNVPGEHYAPTQPFSVGMPNLRQPDLTETDMWGATPVDQLLCRIAFKRMKGGLYVPPSLDYKTIGFPAFDGVMDWYGGTIDPERKILYTNTTYIPFIFELMPHQEALDRGLIQPWQGWSQPYPQPSFDNNPQYGTPYAIRVTAWLNALGIPCNQPPWGQMSAIDLVSRTVIWQRPIGTTRDMGPYGLRMPFGLPVGAFGMGGSVATRSGLMFIAATSDQAFRAIDGRTGNILWETHLPAGGNATPLTYMGKDGRQYVVLAAGGHGGLQTRNGDQVIAYALPRS
ncbi:quinoprotein glucose dehydrogenase [Arboricoccus pini]|uniref:Quinoprotein glucose dehydrogenase n=1 Tax=Arboricoccus pini TaxID=1963835 RepID=A0A212RLA7_9PROT|nr:membrane-bound PQQ-dependent dehydrogenase, glucose/quinate/shikimate family [Arboricoccus pini]SNB73258.1 quinoprotein glucose dehydrogenase [Arboricoccus pini]